jgi:hypothetical protein
VKEKINFSTDGNTVEFYQRTYFQFSPELTAEGLAEDDEVTVLNAALMVNLLKKIYALIKIN